MKTITYWVASCLAAALLIMGATNTLIKFAENTQKYGPLAVDKLASAYSLAHRHPFLLASLAFAGLVVMFINFNTLDVQTLKTLNPTSPLALLTDSNLR